MAKVWDVASLYREVEPSIPQGDWGNLPYGLPPLDVFNERSPSYPHLESLKSEYEEYHSSRIKSESNPPKTIKSESKTSKTISGNTLRDIQRKDAELLKQLRIDLAASQKRRLSSHNDKDKEERNIKKQKTQREEKSEYCHMASDTHINHLLEEWLGYADETILQIYDKFTKGMDSMDIPEGILYALPVLPFEDVDVACEEFLDYSENRVRLVNQEILKKKRELADKGQNELENLKRQNELEHQRRKDELRKRSTKKKERPLKKKRSPSMMSRLFSLFSTPIEEEEEEEERKEDPDDSFEEFEPIKPVMSTKLIVSPELIEEFKLIVELKSIEKFNKLKEKALAHLYDVMSSVHSKLYKSLCDNIPRYSTPPIQKQLIFDELRRAKLYYNTLYKYFLKKVQIEEIDPTKKKKKK